MTDGPPPLRSGVIGFASAQRTLERCPKECRDLLIDLARDSGLRGGPAFQYLGRLLRWHAGGGNYPSPSGKLTAADLRHIEERAAELLRPFEGDPRLPDLRLRREEANHVAS